MSITQEQSLSLRVSGFLALQHVHGITRSLMVIIPILCGFAELRFLC